jgi:hypothetical protein
MQGSASRLKKLDRRATSEETQIELRRERKEVREATEGLRMVQIKDLISKKRVSKYWLTEGVLNLSVFPISPNRYVFKIFAEAT